jgi:hypothetical protein
MNDDFDQHKNTSFLFACKESYYSGAIFGTKEAEQSDGYRRIVEIAETYFSAGMYDAIVQYLSEKRYMVQIWSAHIILQYGSPQADLKCKCISIITDFLESEDMATDEQKIYFKQLLLKSSDDEEIRS